MKIIENVIPDVDYVIAKDYVLGSRIPWYFNNETVYYNSDNLYQFTHTLVAEGENRNLHQAFAGLVSQICIAADVENPILYRVKLNLLPRQPYTEEEVERCFHQDYPELKNLKSIIYYFDDSDGDTVIKGEDGKESRVTPKANSLVMFDSQLYHRATPPTKSKCRVVLNIVYYTEE